MVAKTDRETILRALKLNAQVADLVISGKRDAEAVANILQAIKDTPAFLQVLSERRALELQKAKSNTFPLTVNYTQPLKEMISAGNYDFVDLDITEKHFPISRPPTGLPTKAEVSLELVHFNKIMDDDEVLAEFKKRGLHPANLPELLAFGAKYPEKQRGFPIIALGSVCRYWFGDQRVPYLWGGADERDLRLGWFEGGWSGSARFLGVREG